LSSTVRHARRYSDTHGPIRVSRNNLEQWTPQSARVSEWVANGPDIRSSSSQFELPRMSSSSYIVGETPAKSKVTSPNSGTVQKNGIVAREIMSGAGQLISQSKTSAMAMTRTMASNDSVWWTQKLNRANVENDGILPTTITVNTNKPTAVQPVKLFDAFLPTSMPKNTCNSSNSGNTAIQTARKLLLRKKSI
jgi:hypothetical protein